MSRQNHCVRRCRCTSVVPMVLAIAVLSACGGGGGGGGGQGGATAGGQSAAAPSLTFSASPQSINPGDSTTLQWQAGNADSCEASGAWSGGKPTSGQQQVGPLQADQSFSLSCSGAGGSTLRQVTVNVATGDKDVTVVFDSNQDVVLENGQAQLSWTAENAERCEASGAWSGEQPLSGDYTTKPLTSSATYRITCYSGGDSAVALVTIEVTDKTIRWQAPTENVDGTPLDDLAGFNVYWGNSSRSYTSSQNLPASAREWEVPLGSGTYYLALTALDSENNESGYSNEVRKIIP